MNGADLSVCWPKSSVWLNDYENPHSWGFGKCTENFPFLLRLPPLVRVKFPCRTKSKSCKILYHPFFLLHITSKWVLCVFLYSYENPERYHDAWLITRMNIIWEHKICQIYDVKRLEDSWWLESSRKYFHILFILSRPNQQLITTVPSASSTYNSDSFVYASAQQWMVINHSILR